MQTPLVRKFAPCLPYLAVLLGLYGARNAWAAAIGYHLGMVGVLSLERGWQATGVRVTGKFAARLFVAALLGLGGGVAIYLLWPYFGFSRELAVQLARLGLTATTWPFFIAYFCLVNPWLEERYWRGYLGASSPALTGNDLLFAGYHILVLAYFIRWPWLIASFLALTFTAWAWRQEARISQNLLTTTTAHFFADAGIIVVIYWVSIRYY